MEIFSYIFIYCWTLDKKKKKSFYENLTSVSLISCSEKLANFRKRNSDFLITAHKTLTFILRVINHFSLPLSFSFCSSLSFSHILALALTILLCISNFYSIYISFTLFSSLSLLHSLSFFINHYLSLFFSIDLFFFYSLTFFCYLYLSHYGYNFFLYFS